MKTFKLIALLAAIGVSSATASAQVTYDIKNPSGVVRNFDTANIAPVLTELGFAFTVGDIDGNGAQEIRVERDGMVFFIIPAACSAAAGGCIGAQTAAFFSTPPVNQQTINAFNLRFPFGSAGPLENGFYVTRYDIADFGIARGNVESSIDSFLNMVQFAWAEFVTSKQTASAEGYADDMAASLLNKASAVAGGFVAATPPRTHIEEVAMLADRARALAGAASPADFNKIANDSAN